MRKKGQFWVIDVSTAIYVFIIALAIIILVRWSIEVNLGEDRERVVRETLKFSDTLLSPGNPENWTGLINPNTICTNTSQLMRINRLGLTMDYDNNTFDVDKVRQLLNISNKTCGYSVLRDKFKLAYDFQLSVYRGDDLLQVDGRNFSVGLAPLQPKTVINIERIAVYNNSVVMMRLLVWTNETWK